MVCLSRWLTTGHGEGSRNAWQEVGRPPKGKRKLAPEGLHRAQFDLFHTAFRAADYAPIGETEIGFAQGAFGKHSGTSCQPAKKSSSCCRRCGAARSLGRQSKQPDGRSCRFIGRFVRRGIAVGAHQLLAVLVVECRGGLALAVGMSLSGMGGLVEDSGVSGRTEERRTRTNTIAGHPQPRWRRSLHLRVRVRRTQGLTRTLQLTRHPVSAC